MDTDQKQLQEAFEKAAKAIGLATRQDVEASEERIVAAVDQAFQDHQAALTRQLDRIEKIVDAWPPPSYVTDLLERVSAIEHRLGMKPTVRRAA